MSHATWLGSLCLLQAACAPVRFLDRAILWRVADDAPIPRPGKADISIHANGLRDALFLPADRALALDYIGEARNVNALDEVPDSSWFSDPRRDSEAARIRPRALTPEEMRRGVVVDGDEPELPITVVRGKTIGATGGFVALDARGVRYLIKLDPPGRPAFATSVEAVVSRLAWASGWLVPAEVILDIPPSQIALSPKAKLTDRWGHDGPYSQKQLSDLLARTPRIDGKIRILASRWLPGENIGSFKYFGRRDDDPNDRVPHEDRRDLRGFGVFAAWVNDIDTFENNTLDMYVGEPGHGHIVHYQQDVGGAFGVWAFEPAAYWMGTETYFSFGKILLSLMTLGLYPRPWDGDVRQHHEALVAASPELAGFEADRFDPRGWHPTLDNPAFVRQTARDRYWGAKRVAAFSAAEIGAAIEAGHYRPEVAEQLFNILWVRRMKIAGAFFADVAPLDYFRFENGRLCFEDLWVAAGLAAGPLLSARERGQTVRIDATGATAVACAELGPGAGYRVLELRAERLGERQVSRAVRVHFIERDGQRRLLGVER